MLIQEAIDLRLASLLRSGKSHRTATFYKFWLNDMAASLLLPDVESITLAQLRAWCDGLIGRGLAVRSRIGAVASAKSFFKWCLNERLIADDPSARLEKPSKPRSLPQALDTGEVLALINACAASSNPARDLALVLMLVETGIRVGELVTLTIDRVDVDGRSIRVRGKTGERFAFFETTTQLTLRKWLAVRPTGIDTLFGLGITGVRLLLKRLAVLAHIDPKQVHPHVFRHTSVVLRIENGAEAADLMNIYGWSSMAMIRDYGQLATERMKKRAMASSPMAGLNRQSD
jgi:site-specific recombinase XerD